jgi:hypothetical protein
MEAAVSDLKVLHEGTEKNREAPQLYGVWTETGIRDLPNTKREI